MKFVPRERIGLYGQLVFASVVLACYAQLTLNELRHVTSQPWQIVAVFLAGACYTVLFSFGGDLCERGSGLSRTGYYIVQCALVTIAIFTSPARGNFAVIALPLVAQAILDLGWRGASIVALWAFGSSVAVFANVLGPSGLWRSSISYIPLYLFVVVFSVVSKRALEAKQDAERLSRELGEANEKLRAHAAAAEELATTRERNRLVGEIHDGVGHYLTVIKVQLDAAAVLLSSDPQRAADSVNKAARLAGDALDDVRRSVGALAADSPRAPLVDTLRQLAADSSPSTTLDIEGHPRPLAPAAEHALYRAAQEGLTNVRKHAGATRATVTLDFRDARRVRLTVNDDGCGAREPAPNGNGYGLRGLRERIALLEGSVFAGNGPEGGFALTVEVPA